MSGRKEPPLEEAIEPERPVLTAVAADWMSDTAVQNIRDSGLENLCDRVEEWVSNASTHALRYSTHGLFRYFGKFPPTVARHLINRYTREGDTVLDPMIGSGTTAVEAMLLKRDCVGFDVNPLSCLITRVKCNKISGTAARKALARVMRDVGRNDKSRKYSPDQWPRDIRIEHYFLPETSHHLQRLRESIRSVEDAPIKEFLLVAFASIIRRVSKATSEQGRLFQDVESAEPDPRPRFESMARKAIERLEGLPDHRSRVRVEQRDVSEPFSLDEKIPLVICHPPYFNGYRYSRIFSLELAWLGFPVKSVARQEVREFFKVGKPENAEKYIDDMAGVLRNASAALKKNGILGLMIGDTILRGARIQVTREILRRVQDFLSPEIIAVRTPKYTEASWVASQRRHGKKIGVRILDFVIAMRNKLGHAAGNRRQDSQS